ncbi:MAG TPA: pyridoxamine 5'-phosphate oxidase family protein [Vicinamibacteria bacterium]|nr:pyridoxamine 5'-phosphate oxidase family protein [Vicinamibacteria bacterium]
MNALARVAPAFVEMAHRIVWCSAATVDSRGRPRSRTLHPCWLWESGALVGWVGTMNTPLKRTHLERTPYISLNYWDPSQDNCTAECRATLHHDDETRRMVWDLFSSRPAPLGYDPANIPGWDRPTADTFAAIRLDPWRLRVFPGSMAHGKGEILTWRDDGAHR